MTTYVIRLRIRTVVGVFKCLLASPPYIFAIRAAKEMHREDIDGAMYAYSYSGWCVYSPCGACSRFS
jgi:hypothetical protein